MVYAYQTMPVSGTTLPSSTMDQLMENIRSHVHSAGGVSAYKEHYKAFVAFNATGATSIHQSFGLTSITDNGVGNYTLNWAVTFANSTCQVVATHREYAPATNSFTPTSVNIGASDTSSDPQDPAFSSIFAAGDLA